MTTAPPMADEELDHVELINTHPDQDNPRLEYADWLEGDAEPRQPGRAEFIRVQCELARIPDPPPEPSVGMRSASREQRLTALRAWKAEWAATYYRLKGRERELLKAHFSEWLPRLVPNQLCGGPDATGVCRIGGCDVRFRRGLVADITISAADWPAVADQLAWRPVACRACDGTGRTVMRNGMGGPISGTERDCPTCKRSGRVVPTDECPALGCTGGWVVRIDTEAEARDRRIGRKPMLPPRKRVRCQQCKGTGRVPRPCPPTAQPLERVRLTGCRIHDSITLPAGFGGPGRMIPNPSARSDTEIEFEFARWPGLVFV